MATEILKLTAQIVMSHASMSELTSAELVEEIKEVFNVLTSLEGPEGEAWRSGKSGRSGSGEETIYPSERYRQRKICSLSGVRQKDANLKSSYSQGPWFNAERIFQEI